MMNKKVTLITAAAAMAQQVSALSAHRYLHQALEKRALDAEKRVAELEARAIKTEWVVETVTVHWSPSATVEAAAADVAAADVHVVQEADVAPAAAAAEQAATTEAYVAQPAPEQTTEQAAPSSTSTSTQAAATTAASSGSSDSGSSDFGAKRGITYNTGARANLLSNSCGERCGWAWNWEQTRNDLDDSIDFIPTLWGADSDRTSSWETNAKAAIESGSKALFAFNEPDMEGQSHLTPSEAATAYKTYMSDLFAGDALLGTPSVTSDMSSDKGLAWLGDFLDACTDCHIDFCNVHWYGPAAHVDNLFVHLKNAKALCGDKPVWLTEFGVTDDSYVPLASGDEVDAFIQEVVPQLEDLDYVQAYSYFMTDAFEGRNILMTADSVLSSAGELYASLST